MVRLTSSLDAGGSFVFSVQDTGIGMTEAEVREALEPFRQVRREVSAVTEGTGLGLPLAVRLTELHGGSLTIESTPGEGTIASARFPPWRVGAAEDRQRFPSPRAKIGR
jgi:signal transduction histidine kinase